jgi:hypothetical protein
MIASLSIEGRASGRFMEIQMNIPAYGVLETALIL